MITASNINIWDVYSPSPSSQLWIGITTNGVVKQNGELVMGRGVALQAKQKIKDIALILGNHVKINGNVPAFLGSLKLFTFPVKHRWDDNKADLNLIKRSAFLLKDYIEEFSYRSRFKFYLPRPGCGNGGLKWEDVELLLEEVCLPDNVIVVTNEREIV